MGRNAPTDDQGEVDLEVDSPPTSAAGVLAVVRSMRMSLGQMGATAYFPEANVPVPLDSTARRSNTPTSKSVVIRLEAH